MKLPPPSSLAVLLFLSLCSTATHAAAPARLRFVVRFGLEQSKEPLDGRMLLMVSTDGSNEPGFQINIYVGDMDNYYLNNTVYPTGDRLKKLASPPYGGEVDYGDRFERCWNGDHTQLNAISRLR